MISVIVPVYNVEKYLDKCLTSILEQTYKDFECIIIDDGSVDDSNIIISEYAKKSSKFKVIHQKNKGVSAARNAGIDIAKGDYITFVDSDDYIANDYLEKFAQKIASTNSDIIICGIVEVYSDSIRECVFEAENTNEIKKNILLNIWPSYPWNKCFKKELFENCRFPIGVIFEDLLTIPELCLKANKIVCIPDTLYYYNRQNINSITAFISTEKVYMIFQRHLRNRKMALSNHMSNLDLLDKCLVKVAVKCLIGNCNDGKLSVAQEQELKNYLQERLEKAEIVGLKNKFWVKMLLANRKKLCAWYARFRGY